MKKIFSILLFSLLIIIFVLPLKVFGIGMMTKPIVIKDVLRGSQTDATLTIYNSESEPINYELVDSGDIKGWTSFFNVDDLDNPITKIKVPAKSRINAIARFSVPKDAPNGEYRGQITILTIPNKKDKTEGPGVAVRLRVSRKVLITVTDKEIVQFDTTFIPTYDVRKGEALKTRVIYDNQGNVAIKPTLQLKITRAGKTLYNAIFPYPEDEEAVRAKTRKEISPIMWPTDGQDNGIYFAEVKVLLNDKTIKEDKFRFTVGYTESNFFASIASIAGGNITLAWFIIGLAFIVLAVIIGLFSKKKDLLKVALSKIKSVFF